MKTNKPRYRAYIKHTGEMKKVDVLDSWLGRVGCMLPHKNSDGTVSDRMTFFSFDDIELMQSTGLRDITQGKDIEKDYIYEGDILELPIFWKKLSPAIVTYEKPNFVVGNDNFSACIEEFGQNEFEDSKIIGNVYQHPELLEDEK